MKTKIREELKSYAQLVSSTCRELAGRTVELACFVEDLLKHRDRYDASIEDMDDRYQQIGAAYMLIEEEKLYLNGATGAVPVDKRLKQELRLYEYAKPRLKDGIADLRYCDEMWFFTTDNLASGWVDYPYIADAMPDIQGIDLTKAHFNRHLRLNWFDIVNPVNDPEREGRWSPFPFVEMFGQWIFTFHYPLYEGGRFKGAVVPHANIPPMLADSIYRGSEKMMAIHDDATLVGINAAAADRFTVAAYKAHPWYELQEKVNFVRDELNLMRNPIDDYAWLADGLRWQREFDLTIEGHHYKVIKERIPEIRVNLVAFLDK